MTKPQYERNWELEPGFWSTHVEDPVTGVITNEDGSVYYEGEKTLRQFHGNGVWKDNKGATWVRQSEMVEAVLAEVHRRPEFAARALREAAKALSTPKEAPYEVWASGAGDWLRERADALLPKPVVDYLPFDQEREFPVEQKNPTAEFLAYNIVNQIADVYHEAIPSEKWVEVRQATNDRLWKWVEGMIEAALNGEKP